MPNVATFVPNVATFQNVELPTSQRWDPTSRRDRNDLNPTSRRSREAIFQRRDVRIQHSNVLGGGTTNVATLSRRDVESQRHNVTEKAKMQNFQQVSKV